MTRLPDLSKLAKEVARLDRALAPIAKRPVDLNDPNWEETMRQAPPAVDQAGVTDAAGAVLDALLGAYADGDEGTRASIRELFARYSSFRWAVHPPYLSITTPAQFRTCLLHLSAVDQSGDARDELLSLHDLCERARKAGIEVAPDLREVAALSSDVNRYGMGSTRQFLLACVQMYG